MSTGETLKRLRRAAGIKQRDLALLSGVAQTTVSKIECGNVTPYRRTLWRLADALDTFGCEGAVDLLDGDWCPHRRKNVNICWAHSAHSCSDVDYRPGSTGRGTRRLPADGERGTPYPPRPGRSERRGRVLALLPTVFLPCPCKDARLSPGLGWCRRFKGGGVTSALAWGETWRHCRWTISP